MYVCLTTLELIRRVYKYCLEEKKTLAVVATAQRKAGLLEKHNTLSSSLALGIGNRNLSIILEIRSCLEEIIDLDDPLA